MCGYTDVNYAAGYLMREIEVFAKREAAGNSRMEKYARTFGGASRNG